MKKLLLVFLMVGSFYSYAQNKKEKALQQFFLAAPISLSFEDCYHYLDTCSFLGIDSVAHQTVFSSVKRGVSKDSFYSNGQIIVVLKRLIFYDSISHQVYDTSVTFSVEHLFGKDEAASKSRDAFYKQCARELMNLYSFSHEFKRNTTGGKLKTFVFQLQQFDNFPVLALYSGKNAAMGQYYVTIRYDKRRFYQVKNPEVKMFIYRSSF